MRFRKGPVAAIKAHQEETSDPDVLMLHTGLLIGTARRWFLARGYRAMESPSFQGGVLYAKGNEAPRMMCFGETMRWDGEEMILGG